MRWTIGTSGVETLSCSANIFVGQTEAPLLIKPFIRFGVLHMKGLSFSRFFSNSKKTSFSNFSSTQFFNPIQALATAAADAVA